jgi:hypothetical protein
MASFHYSEEYSSILDLQPHQGRRAALNEDEKVNEEEKNN